MTADMFFPGSGSFLVISDSHHNTNALDRIAEISKAHGGIMMLGDNVDDASYLEGKVTIPVYCVRGNCDFPGTASVELRGRFGGEDGPSFLACHGHKYGVKNGLMQLMYHALEEQVGYAFYGHTHIPDVVNEQGVTLCNPGALKDGYYAIARLDYGVLRITLRRLEDE